MKMKNEIDDIIAVTRNLQLIQSEFELMEAVTHQKDSFKEQRKTVFDEIWDFLGVEANGKDETVELMEEMNMGKKMPKYVVFNMNIGREYHKVAEYGDDLDDLLVKYHGKAYQVMAVKPVFEREEW